MTSLTTSHLLHSAHNGTCYCLFLLNGSVTRARFTPVNFRSMNHHLPSLGHPGVTVSSGGNSWSLFSIQGAESDLQVWMHDHKMSKKLQLEISFYNKYIHILASACQNAEHNHGLKAAVTLGNKSQLSTVISCNLLHYFLIDVTLRGFNILFSKVNVNTDAVFLDSASLQW